MAFGAECDDGSILQNIAALIDTDDVQRDIHARIADGASYAVALSEALSLRHGIDSRILREPNNILAIEYLRACGDTLTPMIIKREGARHSDKNLRGFFSSGTAIRNEALKTSPRWALLKNALPAETYLALQNKRDFPVTERLFRPLMAKLMTSCADELTKIYGMNEGLPNKFLRGDFSSLDELLTKVSGKRYPKSRIARAVLHILLGLSFADAKAFDDAGAQYLRVLAFNERGRRILRELKKRAALPAIMRLAPVYDERSDDIMTRMLRYDIRATDLHGLCGTAIICRGRDFLTTPIYWRGALDD